MHLVSCLKCHGTPVGGPESHCVSQESRDGSADYMQVSTLGNLNSFLASQLY